MRMTVIGYWGGYPSKDGASSAYILEKGNHLLMLDIGSGSLMTYQKYRNVTDIDAVLVSHYHPDHIADVGVLQHALLVEGMITGKYKTVPIYGHTEDRDAFRKLDHRYTKATAYTEAAPLNIGPFFIRFLKTKHSVPCYGMRITDGERTLVYTADSAFQEEWIPFSKDADLLIADCNFYAHQDGGKAGHMNSTEVASIAKAANIREVILSHLPHYGDHNQLLKEAQQIYSGKIQLASEGLTWSG